MDVLKSVRKNILDITPYVAGKKPASVGGRQVKLASNENAWGSSPRAIQAISEALAQGLNQYPDAHQEDLRQATVDYWSRQSVSLHKNQLLFGDGSGEVLSLIMDTFLSPGDTLAIPDKSFILYTLLASRQDACIVRSARHTDFSIDLDALARTAQESKARLVVLANPDNPVSTFIDPDSLRAFVDRIDPQTVIVLDEAYIHFAGLENSALHWCHDYPNVVVCHTFSKAYGLAALRVGYAVMHEALAVNCDKIRLPFNLGILQQAGAIAALQDDAFLDQTLAGTVAGRERLVRELPGLGIAIPVQPRANFILADLGERASQIYQGLNARGISIRNLDSFGYGERYARITIGRAEEMDYFLEVLKEL